MNSADRILFPSIDSESVCGRSIVGPKRNLFRQNQIMSFPKSAKREEREPLDGRVH